MNRRRVIAVVAAVILTLIGTLVLLAYVNSVEQRAREDSDLVRTLVAREEIPAGTPASELAGSQRVGITEVPASFPPDDAIRDPAALADLGDQVTLERILEGEPIVARHFGDAAEAQRGGGAGGLERGREIITIALEPQRALGGELAAGDVVGVIASFGEETGGAAADAAAGGGAEGSATSMVLTNISVTNVTGTEQAAGPAGQAQQAVGVSLDVDQADAEVIAFAMEFGNVWLTRQAGRTRPNGGTVDRDSVLGRGSG